MKYRGKNRKMVVMWLHTQVTMSLMAILAVLLPVLASADDLELAQVFSRKGVEGTIVISSLHSGQTYIHNTARANRRFSPASSFKVMNTLIAVEEKAMKGADDVFKWDGHLYDLPAWNHDQTLASAFKVSCVWCYQEIARRIGAEKYRVYLEQAKYGKLEDDFAPSSFWLDGSLQISAIEQVNFLKNVVQRRLSFNKSSYDTLREVMRVEAGPSYSLWAKTGLAIRVTPQIGWYVGYVETTSDSWIFALNMDIRNETDLPLRQELTREALQRKGVID